MTSGQGDVAACRLWAARVLGAAAVLAFGELAVDMPTGFLGAADEVTESGVVLGAGVVLLALVAISGWLTEKRWAPLVTGLLVSVGVAAFVPALATDPVVAGAVVVWLTTLLGRLLAFSWSRARVGAPASRSSEAEGLTSWLASNRLALQHLLVVSVVTTVAVVGFRVGERLPAQGVCLVLAAVALALGVRFALLSLRSGSRAPLLLLGPVGLAAVTAADATVALSWLAVGQAVLLVTLLFHSSVASDLLGYFSRRPALLLVTSFAVIIAAGTLLLSLPVAAAPGRNVTPIDSLFTATSAACVTGLIVLDTPADFSGFGHAVILLLIQVGGLNIMVLSAFAAMLLGNPLGLRGEKALGDVLDLPTTRTAGELATFIVGVTLAIEGAGAVVLAVAFGRHGLPAADAAWRGAFHSVSAFCNAGFALQSDSLAMFQRDPLALLAVGLLIVVGGLGFSVLAVVWRLRTGRRSVQFPTQAKIVLAASAALVALGTIVFALLEWRGSLAGMGSVDKVANAFFQSVTPRTAGFNSLPLDGLHSATLLVLMVFMFIGASPGGTGGGIKTTTAAVLLGAIPAVSRGEARVVLFRRTVPLEIVYRSAAIAVVAASLVVLGTGALLVIEEVELSAAAFEVVSALGTVGLSLGITPTLGTTGKLIVIALMFVGRIGPLALALLLGRAVAGRVRRPDARVMVG